ISKVFPKYFQSIKKVIPEDCPAITNFLPGKAEYPSLFIDGTSACQHLQTCICGVKYRPGPLQKKTEDYEC
ncbi:MAG: hypothetical protein NWR26_09280, partial [Pseudomonadales bacterium]|nr:hypothetical protein [Pseudomonadales bacterium]MDP5060208.1 hypothetical protein [Pseudomonadales bacterium]